MAKMVLKDAFFEVNSVDLSDHVQQVELSYESQGQEAPAMGDDVVGQLAGLKVIGCSVTFLQDYAANEVDATLFSLVGDDNSGAGYTIKVRPTSDAAGSTNPEYSFSGWLQSYPPITGSVGEVHTAQATFVPVAGASDLARGTS